MPGARERRAQLKIFGGNVRRERVARGLTQARLAEMVDLNIRNLQKIEAGETNVLVTTVMRIRRALGCVADKLIPQDWSKVGMALKDTSSGKKANH